MRTWRIFHRSLPAVLAIVLAATIVPDRIAAQPAGQARVFETPEAAVRALVEAVQAEGFEQLEGIFGRRMLEAIPPEERQAVEQRIATGRRLARERIVIEYTNDARTRARVLIGERRFPMAVPLARSARGWSFDADAGIAEMRRQRIAANELNALRAMRAFARAQAAYAGQDWDNDGVLEFAQRIRSTAGARDGLYWREAIAGLTTSMVNEAFADAEAAGGATPQRPSSGYAFRVLTAQGPSAPGGAMSYVINGNMIVGYAIVAWPARPGETGLSTFIMNHAGVILERELGERTAAVVAAMTAFDPAPDWIQVEDEDD